MMSEGNNHIAFAIFLSDGEDGRRSTEKNNYSSGIRTRHWYPRRRRGKVAAIFNVLGQPAGSCSSRIGLCAHAFILCSVACLFCGWMLSLASLLPSFSRRRRRRSSSRGADNADDDGAERTKTELYMTLMSSWHARIV